MLDRAPENGTHPDVEAVFLFWAGVVMVKGVIVVVAAA